MNLFGVYGFCGGVRKGVSERWSGGLIWCVQQLWSSGVESRGCGDQAILLW